MQSRGTSARRVQSDNKEQNTRDVERIKGEGDGIRERERREREREREKRKLHRSSSAVYSNPRITGEERRIGTRDWLNANCQTVEMVVSAANYITGNLLWPRRVYARDARREHARANVSTYGHQLPSLSSRLIIIDYALYLQQLYHYNEMQHGLYIGKIIKKIVRGTILEKKMLSRLLRYLVKNIKRKSLNPLF